MKKIIFCLSLLSTALLGYSQPGLENVIVEKYYVADAADSIASIGILPVGSVTYRVYVDMLPGYKFQAAFGTEDAQKIPLHKLSIKTTTSFFNNEDRGANFPTYTKTQAKNNTVMLDSWLSVGAACAGNFGILKSEDDGANNVVNADGVLANNDASAGIPLTTQDGLIAGTPQTVTTVGIDSLVATVFDATSQASNIFETTNGSWASLNGSVGPTADNKVLIGQFTTDGDFTFELNIQIGTPTGGTEVYVAKDPTGNEVQMAALIFNSITTSAAPVEMSKPVIGVYPNPVNDFVTLNITNVNKSNNNAYVVYGIDGSLIMKKEIGAISNSYTEKINTTSFANGIYFIQLNMNGEIYTQKIVKN